MATQVVAALPDDALADVFRGLPLRSLAVVRCVCKAWRDVVDDRALLLPHLHLLLRTVRGVFMNYVGHHGKRHQHYAGAYVAFDPAESPHYQVILVPAVPAAPLSHEDRRRRAEQERCALLREEEKDAKSLVSLY
ncbi:unnamed protein product [Miscanthus lutarioriparius]|uniref:F-box domain-containing protein n=1 Tax=Miscanthus lutarioriparius TaxID=422564 RepID=A0A811NEP1_9POAL|nr:unnamed protein product [Miscanthus lutarioriparius]